MDKIEKGFEAIESDYDIKKIYEQMENDLIASMKRTLGSHKADEKLKSFNWPQWQAIKLKQLQEYRNNNKDIFKNFDSQINIWIKIRMKKQFREGARRTVKRAIKAGKIRKEDVQLGGSFFGLNHRKLDALIKSTSEDLKDVKYATLRMANDVYRSTIYKAQVYANVGAKTLNQAIDMATKDFLARGFNCIEYKDGSKHNIADYCDMAVRTATARANLMGEGEMRKKLGNPLVYISKHSTSCDKCGKWQGRVYIDDVWSGGTEKDGKYPLLSTAIAGGLFHPRCRHGASTYYEGVNDEPEEIQEIQESEENKNDEYIQELQRRKAQYERMAMGSLFTDNVKNYTNKANDLKKQIENATIELSDEEKQQLTDYTGFDATRINKALRIDNIDSETQRKINLIDNAFKKATPLKEDIVLHRGTIIQSFGGFEKKNKVTYEEIMDLKENFIYDKAFISTSKNKAEELGRNIILKIHVPKGCRGLINIEPYALPKYKYQQEVLLNRNTKFYVKDIKYENKKYYFEVEVIE